jgi:hypothetical protein
LIAVHKGEADPGQQALAIRVIVNKFARAHDLLYIQDSIGDTGILNGRAFVGQQILKHLKIPIGKFHYPEANQEVNKT